MKRHPAGQVTPEYGECAPHARGWRRATRRTTWPCGPRWSGSRGSVHSACRAAGARAGCAWRAGRMSCRGSRGRKCKCAARSTTTPWTASAQ
eukprot:2521071-Prymnesium_polylepis.1